MVIGMEFMESMAKEANPDLNVDLGTLSLNLSASMQVPVKVIRVIKPTSVTHGYSADSDREKSIRAEFCKRYDKNPNVHFHMLTFDAVDVPSYGLAYKHAKKVDNYFNFSR